jgi:hypothetical protein
MATVKQSKRSRDIKVKLIDSKGNPAAGADVEFFINDAEAGGAIVGPSATAQFHTDRSSVIIAIVARFGGRTLKVVLPPGQDDHAFEFDVTAQSLTRKPPIARCPDGTSGQPCVDCVIGGETVRICA